MTKSAQERLDVQILDRSYQLSCAPQDKPMLLECVALVDARMRQVKAAGKLTGTDRIAVMAALTIAKDFLSAGTSSVSQELSAEREEALKKISEINKALEAALAPQEKLF